jgi:CheY-like chemotaxis protein
VPTNSSGGRHRILIVEDFDLTSSFLSNTLKYCRSAQCTCAKSGEEALTIIETEGTFDLIITDVCMSGIGGIEFIRRVRTMETEKDWKAQVIVAMSADESNSEASLEAGSSLFIFKYDEPMHRIFSVLDTVKHAVQSVVEVVKEVAGSSGSTAGNDSDSSDGEARRVHTRSSSV